MNPKIPLPRGWRRRVRSSVLHILALSLCLPKTSSAAPGLCFRDLPSGVSV